MNRDKEAKLSLVAEKTLTIIYSYGLPSLTFSRVSQTTKISRAWLYKYIGNNKNDLLAFAADFFGRQLTHIEQRPSPKNKEQFIRSIEEGFSRLLDICKHNAWLIDIYFCYKGTANPIGKQIDIIEKKFILANTQELMVALKWSESEASKMAHYLLPLRMGLVHQWQHESKSSQSKFNETELKLFFIKLTTQLLGI